MAEAFHNWVNSMSWWEKLYYQLFDPQAITCSTWYPQPGIVFLGPIIALVVIGIVLCWWIIKTPFNADEQTKEENKP